jgi:hypothetical protein
MPKRKKMSGCLRTFLIVGAVVVLLILAANWPKYAGLQRTSNGEDVIAGITAAEIYEDFLSRGFTVMRGGAEGQKWSVMKKDGNVTYQLEVLGRSSSQIKEIRGTVEAPPDADVTQPAAAFLGQVASRPYPGVEPSVARKWVEKNFNATA